MKAGGARPASNFGRWPPEQREGITIPAGCSDVLSPILKDAVAQSARLRRHRRPDPRPFRTFPEASAKTHAHEPATQPGSGTRSSSAPRVQSAITRQNRACRNRRQRAWRARQGATADAFSSGLVDAAQRPPLPPAACRILTSFSTETSIPLAPSQQQAETSLSRNRTTILARLCPAKALSS